MSKNDRRVVKEVTNARLYSDGSIRIDDVRWSYPHIAKPYKSDGDDGKEKSSYSVTAMLPKKTHTAAKELLKKVIQDVMQAADAKVPQGFWCLLDGDKLAEEDDAKSMYAGHFIVKASESRRPICRNRQAVPMEIDEIEEAVYGGMYGNILIRPWYFNGKAKNGKSYPKRVLANLIAVQVGRSGEPFGEGRISDEGVFDEVDGDGFDDDDDGEL